MCLSRAVIRILSDDDYFGLMKWTEVEGIEDKFSRRIDSRCAVFVTHKIGESDKVILLEFGG